MTNKIDDAKPFLDWQFSRANSHAQKMFLGVKATVRLEQPMIEVDTYFIDGEQKMEAVMPLTLNDAKRLIEVLQAEIAKAENGKNNEKTPL